MDKNQSLYRHFVSFVRQVHTTITVLFNSTVNNSVEMLKTAAQDDNDTDTFSLGLAPVTEISSRISAPIIYKSWVAVMPGEINIQPIIKVAVIQATGELMAQLIK